MIAPNIEMAEKFRTEVKRDMISNPDGLLIFDIQCRYRTIESDIIAFAQHYGFDPEWTDDEQLIIDESDTPDDEIEFIHETSQDAEDYLNSLLQWVGIKDWHFMRISESEIWGLFPESVGDDE